MSEALVVTPLFPLSNVVLFPGVRAPLHLFEPRYRQMVRDALEAERRIGMIAVRPEHAQQMAGDPPLFDVGCLGTIVESEALPDGRYNVILAGTSRFRVRRELPRPGERLYRTAEVEILPEPDASTDAARLGGLRVRVLALFEQLVRLSDPERAEEMPAAVFDGVEEGALVNTMSQLLELPALEKQGLLEANGVAERCERLCSVLEFRAAELAWQREVAEPTRH